MNKILFDFWACQRPLTKHWGSGQVLERIQKNLGKPDVAFGKQDQVSGVFTIDADGSVNPDLVSDWKSLPFEDNHFEFGYWDPPYYELDKDGKATLKPCLYKKEGQEIWRVCKRLAILHNYVWPRAWLDKIAKSEREAMIAVTMGPMKQIRLLQVFHKAPNE